MRRGWCERLLFSEEGVMEDVEMLTSDSYEVMERIKLNIKEEEGERKMGRESM